MTDSHPNPRVLMVVPNYPYPVVGGLERQSHELSRALVHRLGIPVHVLSGRFDATQAASESVEGVTVTRIPWSARKWLRFMRSPFDVFSQLWRKRREFDVIHLHQYSSVGLFVIIVARLLGKPILTKLPNVGEFGLPGLRKGTLGRLRLAILLRTDGVVAMSKESIGELAAEQYPDWRILSVPNGISVHDEGATPINEYCRVVFVGRLSPEKDLSTLLKAWAAIQQDEVGEARLELWGDGPLKAELLGRCLELGIASSVVFAGHVADVRTRLRDADVFVLPSLAEGNSNAVLEAMEAGLPVVATKVGGTAMQVGPDGADLLFSPGDAMRLTSILLALIANPHLRRSQGLAMRQRITTHFDIAKIAAAYLCAYRQLVGKGEVDLRECGKLPETDAECAA